MVLAWLDRSSVYPVGESVDGRPRPQLWRRHAESLDGIWGFAPDLGERFAEPGEVEWTTKIRVPFSPGTPASGVPELTGRVWWYRTVASLTPSGSATDGQQVLHFGAIDQVADVWVDGRHVAHHESGYTPLRVELRGQLASPGDHEVVVRAFDDHGDLSKPRGKQAWDDPPRAIWYPPTAGIWQPVWTERLGAASIDAIDWSPDVPRAMLGARVRVRNAGRGCRLEIRAAVGGRTVADDVWSIPESGVVERSFLVDRGAADLGLADVVWSPSQPALVDVRLRVVDPDGQVYDEVESYAGLRSVGVDHGRLLLNGRPIRHRLVLDQGYWPETGLTAPSDDALRRDVELTKQLGFNGVRKHQKVEDPRYLYWADRLGCMVWAELPAAYAFDDVAVRRGLLLWPEIIERDRSHPSIVGWVPCNESWGLREVATRADQRAYLDALVAIAKTLHPDVPVVANDGWEITGGDIVAVHDYDLDAARLERRWSGDVDAVLGGYGTARRRILLDGERRNRPVVLSELGGISVGPEGWGYEKVATPAELLARFEAVVAAVRASPHLAGFCYTQLADTYQERNGLLTAAREPKIPIDRVRSAVRGR
jgi:hypothetical protein